MKRLMIAMSMFVLTSIFVFASDENTFSVNERLVIDCQDETVDISKESIELFRGDAPANYTVLPVNGNMEWTVSSNAVNVAVVYVDNDPNKKGGTGGGNVYIQAEGPGICTITFTRLDNNATGTITVNVLE